MNVLKCPECGSSDIDLRATGEYRCNKCGVFLEVTLAKVPFRVEVKGHVCGVENALAARNRFGIKIEDADVSGFLNLKGLRLGDMVGRDVEITIREVVKNGR